MNNSSAKFIILAVAMGVSLALMGLLVFNKQLEGFRPISDVATGTLSAMIGALMASFFLLSFKEKRPIKVFISYDHDNKPDAEYIKSELSSDLFRVHLDDDVLLPGKSIEAQLEKAISDSDVCLFLFLKKSEKSKWMSMELEHCMASSKPAIPVVSSLEEIPNELKATYSLMFERNSAFIKKLREYIPRMTKSA